MTSDLHLVRLALDKRELLRIAARNRLPYGVDDGYLLHAGLAQLFARSSEPAKVPLYNFVLDDTFARAQMDCESTYVLGYSSLDERGLYDCMGEAKKCLLRQCITRKVPRLETATRLAFRTRICPVVRTKAPGAVSRSVDAEGRARSREVDAWLAYRFRDWQPRPPTGQLSSRERVAREWDDRERVYSEWLARELSRGGAAQLEGGAKLETFRRSLVYRKGAKNGRLPERPDAVMVGQLRILDDQAFRTLLTRGVGRHRSFGFGMLLLRPV